MIRSAGGRGAPLRSRLARARRYAPMPLVAVAVLLVVLILITPALLSSGQPAPGILTQAELVVDRLPNNATMHFYVHGLGTTVRYQEIWVGLSSDFGWDGRGSVNWTGLNWTTWQNDSNVIETSLSTRENPVAVNVTAYYVSPGGNAWYVGVIAFFVTLTSSTPQLYLASGGSHSVAIPSSPVTVDNSSLPLPITLTLAAHGAPP